VRFLGSRNLNVWLVFSNFFEAWLFCGERKAFWRKKWFFIKLDQWCSMLGNRNLPVISQNLWIRESHYGTPIRSIMYHSVHDRILFCFGIELSEAHGAGALLLEKYFSTAFRSIFMIFVGNYRWNQKYRMGEIVFPGGIAVVSNRVNNKSDTKLKRVKNWIYQC
jgi:hypothetical protein